MDLMSQDISKITEALAKAKAGFGPIVKNKTVKTASFSYDYADLPSIEDAIKVPLMENGLTVFQPITVVGEQRMLVTILSHTSGQWVKGMMPLSAVNGKMQEAGKEITYFRRYALCSMIGITPEDDTDGNEAVGNDKRPTSAPIQFNQKSPSAPPTLKKDQIDHIKELIGEYPEIREEVLKFTKKNLIQDIEADKYDAVLGLIMMSLKKLGVA